MCDYICDTRFWDEYVLSNEKMNRFILTRDHLNKNDELVWYKRRPNGSLWRCLWRKGKNYISFVAIEIKEYTDYDRHIQKDEEVKIAFTILCESKKDGDGNGN